MGIWNVACVAVAASVVLSGCGAGKPRSSALRAADMEMSCAEIQSQLAASPFLAQRHAESPEVVLVPGAMENRSYERLSRLDRFGATVRMLNDPLMRELFARTNVRVIEPPDDTGVYKGLGLVADGSTGTLAPTHIVNATFGSVQRQASGTAAKTSDFRKDLFLIQFEVVNVGSREMVWSGSFEFARVAYGELID